MLDNKHYYDEQIKGYYYERYFQSFNKSKEELKDTKISNLLSLQTKPELTEIAKRLDAKGYSKLGKEALIQFIGDFIIENADDILSLLSFKELTYLKYVSKYESIKYSFIIDELTSVGGLSALGLLFKVSVGDNFYLVVPEELKASIKKLTSSKNYMNEIKERSKGIAFIDGLMIHYGMLLGGTLYELITNKDSNIFKEENLDFYLNYIFRSYEAFTDANSLIHPYLFSPEDLFEELIVRRTIPYEFNNEDYFVSLGEDFKSTWSEDILSFKELLLSRKIKKENADLLVSELLFYIKNDLSTQSIVDLLTERGVTLTSQEDAKDIIDAFTVLYNNSSIWTLKGLSPKLLAKRRTTVVKKDKEPGRNDPCTCGSGKKYKKCCGK